MIKDHRTELLSFIKEVSETENFTSDKVNKNIAVVRSIYGEGWRHSYSVITQYFLECVPPERLQDYLTQASANLTSILIKFEDDCPSEDDKDPCYNRCHRNLEKLIDHISLESIRLSYTNKIKEDSLNSYIKLQKDTDKLQNDTKDLLEKTNKASEKIKSISYKLANIRIETVTLLGIFASIVVAYVSGSSLSAAIFANMDKVDTPLLCFLTVLIVIFISNLVYYLFALLRKINGFEEPKTPVWLYNLVLGCVALGCIVWHCYTAFW